MYNEAGLPLENNFEKLPGSGPEASAEQLAKADEWAESMQDAPEFAGDESEIDAPEEPGEDYNQGVADAAALMNYGINAATRRLGVENAVQKLKGFDVSGSDDPMGDFFKYLEVEAPGGHNTVSKDAALGALVAIADMKELISEVEGADPRYADLRAGAKSAGEGYFEYAASMSGTQDLAGLFEILAAQKENS